MAKPEWTKYAKRKYIKKNGVIIGLTDEYMDYMLNKRKVTWPAKLGRRENMKKYMRRNRKKNGR